MLKYIVSILLTLAGCTQTQVNTESRTSTGIIYGEGIVSEDPPGADDWDSEDTDKQVDTDIEKETPMIESYTGCSNQIDIWSEPDPLTHPCNFRLLDQDGDSIELYDFEGDVILVDFSTMWCSVCKIVAEHVQEMHDQYSPFSIITVLTENTSGNPPTVDNLKEWSDEYGITTAPVLAANDTLVGTEPDQWSVSGLPCFFLIDKDFYVRIIKPGWNEETMTRDIENLLLE